MALKHEGQESINVTVAFLVLATVATFLRFCIRFRYRQPFIASDWLICAALISCGAYSGVILQTIIANGTLDVTVLSLPEITSVTKSLYAAEYILGFAITFVKLSILLLYRSIFDYRAFHRAVLAVIGLSVAWFFGTLFLIIFQCNPVAGGYNLVVRETATCIPFGNLIAGYEISNIVVDIVILALPINEIRKLHMPTSKKVAISSVFLLGSFVIATSIIRIVYSFKTDVAGIVSYPTVIDWTTVQIGAAIIGGNLPTLRPLFPDALMVSRIGSWAKSMVSSSQRSTMGGKDASYASDNPSTGSSSNNSRAKADTGLSKGDDDFDDDIPLQGAERC